MTTTSAFTAHLSSNSFPVHTPVDASERERHAIAQANADVIAAALADRRIPFSTYLPRRNLIRAIHVDGFSIAVHRDGVIRVLAEKTTERSLLMQLVEQYDGSWDQYLSNADRPSANLPGISSIARTLGDILAIVGLSTD